MAPDDDLIGDRNSGPWAGWYRFVARYVATVYALIAIGCWFGPDRWFASNSLDVIHDVVRIPWPAWGFPFALVAVGVATTRFRLAAYFLGAFLGGLFITASIIWTVLPQHLTNPIVIGLSLLSPLMMVAGMRYAVVMRQRGRA